MVKRHSRFRTLAVIALLLSAPSYVFSAGKISVGVLDFKSNGFPPNYGRILADEARSELAQNPSINVVNRENLPAILQEHVNAQSGLVDDGGKIREFGSAAGAEYFITGSIGTIKGMTVIYVKCIDVGAIANTSQQSKKGDFSSEDILRQVRLLTRNAVAGIGRKGNDSSAAGSPPIPGFVYIPGGAFSMGDSTGNDDEKPAQSVTVGGFYLKTTEVTCAEYQKFCAEAPYNPPQKTAAAGSTPVVFVSWNDAAAYCDWYSTTRNVTMRLPTEAEWEYACKKGLGPVNVKKKKFDRKCIWFAGNAGNSLHPAGSSAPDAQGVCDLLGNVAEWCADWYGAEYYQEEDRNNPVGPEHGTYRVVRGGSAFDAEKDISPAKRGSKFPEYKFNAVGFRPVILHSENR